MEHAANNGTASNCLETLVSQSDYEENILKTMVRLQGQSIYEKMSHNVVYAIHIEIYAR